ncbi:phosphatidylserine decarboxylase [Heyndrickxia acidicola]|uniref:Phosphatidylserine decarboxylase proenzyme n=1 Tax=Heyndrickxia acidicola TaxID=209389 RepID=A0ABU6MKL1_9BACI|nr:phosphatidylserine decarboxylase [Heyndrickxia acidicola]MED1205055.1 phosphatidylserine decarboxylase [Heyndrickxia acidicola]
MEKWLYRFLIELTNHKFTSNLLKNFSRSRMSRLFINSYAKAYKINVEEMMDDIQSYQTLHEFFIRRLKSDARVIDPAEETVASPVDGVIEEFGTILPSKEILVKGKLYSIEEMLGDPARMEKYMDGSFVILYLSPSHYHRIHSPLNAHLVDQYVLGNRSYPVNKYGLKYGKSTLSKNYRVVSELKHHSAHIAMVKVGAMFINTIECTYKNENWKKGEEIAYFSFGSTVVLLFEKGTFTLNNKIKTPYHVKMGESIGSMHE